MSQSTLDKAHRLILAQRPSNLKWNVALGAVAIPFVLCVVYLLLQSQNNGVLVLGGNQSYGKVIRIGVERYEVKILNLSLAPVLITVEPGCRCTTANITQQKIPFVGVRSFFVSVRTGGSTPGHHVKSVEIYFQSRGTTWSRTALFAYESR